MKKLILSLTFLLVSFTIGFSQGNGNVNGNGNCNAGNGNNNPSPCGITLQPGDVITGCNGNGLGTCPYAMNLVGRVLKAAKDAWGNQMPLSHGQMIQEYHECRCVITYMGGSLFKVEIGGLTVTVSEGF